MKKGRESKEAQGTSSKDEQTSIPRIPYMQHWEAKVGNDERNIPLTRKVDLTSGYYLRRSIEKEQDIYKEIFNSLRDSELGPTAGRFKFGSTKHFIVIHFGCYYIGDTGAYPAEFSLVEFTIKDGLRFSMNHLLDPGTIPFGFKADFMRVQKEKNFLIPGENDKDRSNRFNNILNVLEILTERYQQNGKKAFLYTLDSELATVEMCLEFVRKRVGSDKKFTVYSLNKLVEVLIREGVKFRHANGYKELEGIKTSEEYATVMLLKSGLEYIPEIACRYHAAPIHYDKVEHCSMNKVKRWVYNALEVLTKLFGYPLFYNRHIPKYRKDGFCYVTKMFNESDTLNRRRGSVTTRASSIGASARTRTNSIGSDNTETTFSIFESESNATTGDVSIEYSDDENDELDDTVSLSTIQSVTTISTSSRCFEYEGLPKELLQGFYKMSIRNNDDDKNPVHPEYLNECETYIDHAKTSSLASSRFAVESLQSAKSSNTGCFSSVTHTQKAFSASYLKKVQQANYIVKQGLKATTTFVDTNKVFWNTKLEVGIGRKIPVPKGPPEQEK